MARANKRDTEIRAALETICTELAVIRRWMPVTRLRVVQAQQRSGLVGLLDPALDEMDDVNRSITVIRNQVDAALANLKE